MPVTGELLALFRSVGSEVSRLLSEYRRVEVEGGEWVPVGGSLGGVYIGVDSSRQSELFRFFFIFAVQGVAVVYDASRGVISNVSDADVGYVELAGSGKFGFSSRNRDALISSSSRNLEVSLAHEALSRSKSADLILMDGSYASFTVPVLISPKVYERFKELEKLVDRLHEGWAQRIRMLGSLSKSSRIAFISKSVTKTHLTSEENPRIKATVDGRKTVIPDFMAANLIAAREGRKPGFLWYDNPYFEIRSGTIDMAKREGITMEKWYTLTYILLHPAGRLYQATMPGKLTKGEVEQIVKTLLKVSPEGYPQPLSIPHHTSRLTRRDFKSIIALTIPQTETGREPLEQVVWGKPGGP
ncbi:MAG: DNA double-strand break repair nuclease NurA [Thermoprotei archaeon]|nr:DNA double-strand break repair nuclease NurA [Thermoprotei archaeon]